MSKMKDAMERIHEMEYEHYVSFMEWVCDQEQEVSESDIAKEEEESSQKEPSTPRTSIVHKNTLNAVNNIDFNPQIGA